jgi:hypothetical protein
MSAVAEHLPGVGLEEEVVLNHHQHRHGEDSDQVLSGVEVSEADSGEEVEVTPLRSRYLRENRITQHPNVRIRRL